MSIKYWKIISAILFISVAIMMVIVLKLPLISKSTPFKDLDNKTSTTQEEEFAQKVKCEPYYKEELQNLEKKHTSSRGTIVLSKSVYSQLHNSCLFVYTIEYDRWNFYSIKDMLTGEIIINTADEKKFDSKLSEIKFYNIFGVTPN